MMGSTPSRGKPAEGGRPLEVGDVVYWKPACFDAQLCIVEVVDFPYGGQELVGCLLNGVGRIVIPADQLSYDYPYPAPPPDDDPADGVEEMLLAARETGQRAARERNERILRAILGES